MFLSLIFTLCQTHFFSDSIFKTSDSSETSKRTNTVLSLLQTAWYSQKSINTESLFHTAAWHLQQAGSRTWSQSLSKLIRPFLFYEMTKIWSENRNVLLHLCSQSDEVEPENLLCPTLLFDIRSVYIISHQTCRNTRSFLVI